MQPDAHDDGGVDIGRQAVASLAMIKTDTIKPAGEMSNGAAPKISTLLKADEQQQWQTFTPPHDAKTCISAVDEAIHVRVATMDCRTLLLQKAAVNCDNS